MTKAIVDKMIGKGEATHEKIEHKTKKLYKDKYSKDQYIMVAGTPVSLNRP